MRKARRLHFFLGGYREVIKGSNLDIVNVTPAEHKIYEEGREAARDDMQIRAAGPFNDNPEMRFPDV